MRNGIYYPPPEQIRRGQGNFDLYQILFQGNKNSIKTKGFLCQSQLLKTIMPIFELKSEPHYEHDSLG